MESVDFVIIGAGIAGAAAAYSLAPLGRTLLLERESAPGYHTTGRSAAVYTETYGSSGIRALTIDSGRFLRNPPEGFVETRLLTPRGVLLLGRDDQRASLESAFEAGLRFCPDLRLIDGAEARKLVPVLAPEYVAGAVHEPSATDIDVHALHQGYLRGMRARGGRLVTNADVHKLHRKAGSWTVGWGSETVETAIVVNAAGAWADAVARMAGAPPIGLVPKRRTAFTFDPPEGIAIESWPVVIDVDEGFYFKPESGRLLGSPADETPSPACDAQPEEYDIAVAADKIETATTMKIRHLSSKWAGLRSFVHDKMLVIGADDHAEGFYWLAGQGGYGIQTSPAAASCLASLITSGDIPGSLSDLGLTAAALSPARCQQRQPQSGSATQI
jgi:D-arginine dehydrogenase